MKGNDKYMYTNKLMVNGEVLEVTEMASPFTHGVVTGFFDNLGANEVLDVVIGQSLGEGLFTAHIVFKTEIEPTLDDLQTYLKEYEHTDTTVFLETQSGTILASAGVGVSV
jgi:hypothetical protein